MLAIVVAGSFPPFWNMNIGAHGTYPSPSALINLRTFWAIEGCPCFLRNRPTHFDPCAADLEVCATCVFIWKLFPDVALLYGFLVGLFFMARIARLRRSLPLLLLIWMAVLVVCWTVYWFWGYCRIQHFDFLERCARSSGHVANLMLVLLMWSRCVRTVWQPLHVGSTVLTRTHHFLGFLFALSLGTHFALWFLFWALSGNLSNLVSPAFNPHVGDLVTSLPWVRNVAYWLFSAIHRLFALVISLAALSHSWALWIFLWPPLALVIVEHAMVLFDSRCQEAHLERVDASHPGYLVVSVYAPVLAPQLRAGNYVRLMIPEISPSPWHPFSFVRCTNTGDGLQLFIRSSSGSWWRQHPLLRAGTKCHLAGPYDVFDIPGELVGLQCVVLVCGGSGLAAVAALASQMDFEPPPIVHIVVIEKNAANFEAFEWLWTENPHLVVHKCVGRACGLECASMLLLSDGAVGCLISGPKSLHDALRPMAKHAHVMWWHEFAFEV